MPAQGSAKAIHETEKQPVSAPPRGRATFVEWLQTWGQVLIAEVISAWGPAGQRRNR